MAGKVFQCYEEQTDRMQYTKTMEALETHMKKTMTYPEDLAPLFALTMAEPTLAAPAEPGDDATRTQEVHYAEKFKAICWRSTPQSGVSAAKR